MFTFVKKFLGPVRSSVKGEVQTAEVARSSVLSIISGSSVLAILSAVWSLLQFILADPNLVINVQNLAKLFSEKNYIAIIVALITFIADFLRRKYAHGN